MAFSALLEPRRLPAPVPTGSELPVRSLAELVKMGRIAPPATERRLLDAAASVLQRIAGSRIAVHAVLVPEGKTCAT